MTRPDRSLERWIYLAMGAGLLGSAALTLFVWAQKQKRQTDRPSTQRSNADRAHTSSPAAELAGLFEEEREAPSVEQLLFATDTFDVLEEPSLDDPSSDELEGLLGDELDRN